MFMFQEGEEGEGEEEEENNKSNTFFKESFLDDNDYDYDNKLQIIL